VLKDDGSLNPKFPGRENGYAMKVKGSCQAMENGRRARRLAKTQKWLREELSSCAAELALSCRRIWILPNGLLQLLYKSNGCAVY
jgi:hypothetical protein